MLFNTPPPPHHCAPEETQGRCTTINNGIYTTESSNTQNKQERKQTQCFDPIEKHRFHPTARQVALSLALPKVGG